MNRFRTVGARLSLALLLVVAVALGVVYAVVVPSLRDRLVNAKLVQLERAAPTLRREFILNQYDPDFVRNAAASTDARVVRFVLYSQTPPALNVLDDSQGASSADVRKVEDDPIAARAATSLRLEKGTVSRGAERFAEVAIPAALPTNELDVLLLSASLKGALADVHQVQRRLLFAGLLALLVALAIGYVGAWAFARRIRRLERAADRIAGGRFDEPVTDPAVDELGQLARAFERMRLRLAYLDRARGEFIANASHELRTPLFSLGGFLELLRDEELDEATRREFLEAMTEQVERLTKLASELLDLTRLDAGRMRVEQEQIDLAAVAKALAEEFGPIALASQHTLEVETNGGLAALADEQRVLQIGRILVENALVHTAPATPVRIRSAAENGRAVLVVEDEGEGIPPDEHEQLFERFYRLEGTKASGSGLGLAIARELATLMGGSITLDSEHGRTAFALVLPSAGRAREPAGSQLPH
jgi:signal transduction histidine kinase